MRLWLMVWWVLVSAVVSLPAQSTGVLVYGATPAGIAAALAVARDGQSVLLVEPTARIGGMLTHGLSHTDFHAFEGLTGSFREFQLRVQAHYRQTYGADSPQWRDSFRGTHGEPGVNLQVLEQMLAEFPAIRIERQWVLRAVQVTGVGASQRLLSATFADRTGNALQIRAAVFIDATYEGDLLALAGVPYRVGREGRAEHGESLAPEQGDRQLQAYNFRLCMTQNPTNRVFPAAPDGYRSEDFAGVVPLLADGRIKQVFGYPGGCIFKAQQPPLPNGKYDINDVSRGLVRLSLPGENLGWPEGDAAERGRIFDRHVLWNIGLLYFLQNDPAVPAQFRLEARSWGLCRDEFKETNHLPGQLYVREARRMTGQYVFAEKDTDYAPGDARSVWQPDAIAMGEYGPNCHGTGREGTRFQGRHTGEFYKPVAPYQIPYGVLLPKDVQNLLVPGAMSASHVGFCALRLEPIWMSLGQAAGHAAHRAIADRVPVQQVSVVRLRDRLHERGAATIYTSDVPEEHPSFGLVQWWGGQGGLHGLAPAQEKAGPRGKNIIGQYYETYPGHEVRLDQPLTPELAERWNRLAARLKLDPAVLPKADGRATRADWLRAAAQAAGRR